MPRRTLPFSSYSSSPSRLSCLAVLTAAWGSHGFRPPLLSQVITHRELRTSVGSSTRDPIPAAVAPAVGRPVVKKASAHAGAEAVSYRGRQKVRGNVVVGCSGDAVAVEDASDVSASAAPHASEEGERPWLGNGPDPMIKTGKIRPGTRESLLGVQTTAQVGQGTTDGEGGDAEAKGNGPDPMASFEAALMRRRGKGKGVAAEEMWLNGPFKAPLPLGPLDILYVDDDIVVANKPSNLLCVPGRAEKDSLATRAAYELGHYRVDRMIVHRLDMATSGCVIMARSDLGLKDLNRQFRERQVRKRYVAMVHGVLRADEGEVDVPLCRNRACPPLHMVNFEHGKPSLTKWRVLERAADRTRVELIPVSGRSHQLRLHMDAIGHPILGDHFYGTKESLALADRCLLHAHTLCLRHPRTGERTMFTAPCEF